MAGIEIQEPSDYVKVSDLEVQGARKLGNVISHLHMRIKNSTEVFNKRRTLISTSSKMKVRCSRCL